MQSLLFKDEKKDPINEASLITLQGVLKRVLFSNQENAYTIGLFVLPKEKKTITVTGHFPAVQCGETLILKGQWIDHAHYGKQFQCVHFESHLPSDIHGIRQYLSSGLIHGIGKTYANKIVEYFGLETFKILNEAYAHLLNVPGIGPKRAKSIKQAWDQQQAVREVMIFLQTYGFTNTQCLRLFQKYGSRTKEIVRENPYVIVQTIEGIGFRSADKIALNLGLGNDSTFRIDAGLEYQILENESEGNTGCNKELLLQKSAELLDVGKEKIAERLQSLLEEDRLAEWRSTQLIQRPKMAMAEAAIAKHVHRLANAPSLLPHIQVDKALQWTEERLGIAWSETQKNALFSILGSKLAILTGGPGTGKTTLLRALVEVLKAKKVRLALAAPTGRASQRMGEATAYPAKTVHRTLKYEPSIGQFTFNEDNPLPVDFLVLDEASMLDVSLTYALLKALPDSAHVLLVGDIYQLPSVGPGNILNDLIHSDYFHVHYLQEIFRQGERSSIVSTAHAVLAGKPKLETPLYSPETQPHIEEDFHFIVVEDPDACLKTIETLCWEKLPQWYQKDPMRDIQVLAPMHRGKVGIEQINQRFQERLGTKRKKFQIGNQTFYLGDKVIQLKNNYDKNIFNGDLGIIKDINEDENQLWVQFNEECHSLDRMEALDLKPAYAISIHKSQGSEFPIVVLPLLTQHFVMLKRNLLYTAITRGRKKVFLVGDFKAFSIAVRTQDSTVRKTTLKDRLKTKLLLP